MASAAPSLLTRPRMIRAMTEDFEIEMIHPDIYRVHSPSGNTYHVNVAERWCSCPDHEYRGVSCKHLCRVMLDFYSARSPLSA